MVGVKRKGEQGRARAQMAWDEVDDDSAAEAW